VAGPNTIEILIRARDEATAQLQQVSSSLGGFSALVGRVASGLGPLGAVLAIIGAGAAAAGKAAHSLADEVERLDNLSKQTGVSVGNLQTMQQILREAGGSAEDANIAFNFLNRAIATQDPLLKKLGITTKDTWQAFNQLVQILAASKDHAARVEVAYQLLGRGSAVLLGKIDQLAQQLPNARSEMEKLGVVMSDKTLEGARALDKQTDELNRQWVGLTNGWKANTIPVALAMVAAFKELRDIIAEISGKHVEVNALDVLNKQLADAEERLAKLKNPAPGAIPNLTQGPLFGPGLSDAKNVELLTERIKALRHEIESIKLVPAAAAISSALGALGVHLTPQQVDVVVKPHVTVQEDPNLAQKLKELAKVDLTPAQKELAELERLFEDNAARARDLQAEIHKVDDSTKRLQIRDALIKVGVDFDKEQLDRNLADAQARLEKKGIKVSIGAESDIPALDAALKEYGVKANTAQLHAILRAAGDFDSLNAVLLAFGVKLTAAQLKVVVKAVRDEQEGATLQPKGIVARSTPPPLPPISQPIPFDFDKARKAQQDLIAQAPKLRAAFASVAEGWKSAVEDMLTQTAIANAAFSALYNGLQSGFQTVASQLLTTGQTLKSAMVTIFKSLVNEVLAELARLAGAAVFKFLIGFLGGGPAGAAISLVDSGVTGGGAGLSSAAPAAAQTVVVAAPAVNVSVAAPAAPVVSVAAPAVTVAAPPTAAVSVSVAATPPPVVRVAVPPPADVTVNVPPPAPVRAAVAAPPPPVVRVSVPPPAAVSVPSPAVSITLAPAPAVRVAAPAVNLSLAAPDVSVAPPAVHVAVPAPPALRVAPPAVSLVIPPAPAISVPAPRVSVVLPAPPAVRVAAPAVNLSLVAPAVSVAAAAAPVVNVAPAASPAVSLAVAAPAVSVAAPSIPRPAVAVSVPELKLPALPALNISSLAGALAGGLAGLRASLAGASRALTPPTFAAARLAAAPAFALAAARPVAGFAAGRTDTAELAGLLREQNKMLRDQRLFAAAGGGNTYQINALDARSVTLDLLAPSGNLRRANDRIAEIAAVA
jgi:hypothetical protein